VSRRNSSTLDSHLRTERRPILCYVTDRHGLQNALEKDLIESLLAKLESLAAAGIDLIQLREKDLSGRVAAALTHEALRRVSRLAGLAQAAPRILVNDRLDVALAEKAGGVHLSENSLPVHEAKRLLLAYQVSQSFGSDFLVGVSCHSLEAAQSAAAAGADYVFFGPVFATPSKAAYGAPQGLDRLAEVCGSLDIPVLAIGGISLANVASCFSAGASGIAAIRLFQNSIDPVGIIQTLRRQSW
jgi:thiamine-phosphate pyrophosphorylase